VDEAELLSIGEQPSLRQSTSRTAIRIGSTRSSSSRRCRSSPSTDRWASARRIPGTNFALSTGDQIFGLRSADSRFYSVGFDFVPSDKVSLGATYGFEKYTALQASRTANPLPANTIANLLDPTQQFNDPRRDWTDDSADQSRSITASLDLIKLLPKFDLKFAYDYNRAKSTYGYGLAPNTVLPTPLPLTPVVNERQFGTIDGSYFLTRRFAVGMVYWHDQYRVDDFALNPVASLAQPATGTPTLMMVGYFTPHTPRTRSWRDSPTDGRRRAGRSVERRGLECD
jgi:hypothetical protein